MTEQQTMLGNMADGLFAGLGAAATVGHDWGRIEEIGFAGLLLGEESGGFGGNWSDANIVFRLSGYHALALPLAEAVIAARIAVDCGFATQGFGTLAERTAGTLVGGRFSGAVTSAAWGRDAAFVVAPAPSGGAMILPVAGAQIQPHANAAGEPRDTLLFASAQAVVTDHDVFALGAAARTMQMAGALDAALALAVAYVNERRQFGKPLGKLQAVQQALAVFACEAAAANCAAVGMAHALDAGDPMVEIAAAKARANMAAAQGAAIAHQAHGAIGFTQDYGLHPLTRRLWSWRSEFGGESHWTALLGGRVIGAGADNFWANMVRRSDAAA